MKYMIFTFTLLLNYSLLFAQTEPLEGKGNAIELNKEIEEKKKGERLISQNSISESQLPLYIVERVAVDKNVLDNIDPNTIKSIEVLKGIAATSLYGIKASNGVIVVTLKKKYAKKFRKKHQKK